MSGVAIGSHTEQKVGFHSTVKLIFLYGHKTWRMDEWDNEEKNKTFIKICLYSNADKADSSKKLLFSIENRDGLYIGYAHTQKIKKTLLDSHSHGTLKARGRKVVLETPGEEILWILKKRKNWFTYLLFELCYWKSH